MSGHGLLQDIAHSWWSWQSSTAVQGVVAASMLALAWRWIGRAPSRIKVLLLLVALAKFVVPVPLSVPLPVLRENPTTGISPAVESAQGPAPIDHTDTEADETGSAASAEPRARSDALPIDPDRGRSDLPPALASRASYETSSPSDGTIPSRELFVTIIFLVWLAGASAIAGISIHSLIRARALERGAEQSRELTGLAEGLRAGLGIRKPVPVLVTDSLHSPMVMGFLRPRVLISSAHAGLGGRRLDMLLQHELAHIGRLDHLLVLLRAAFVVCVWWNPAAHYLNSRIHEETENAADDAVLRGSAGGPKAYGKMLLAVAESVVHKEFSLMTPTLFDSRNLLRKRLRRIVMNAMHQKRMRTAFFVPICLLLVSLLPAWRLEPRAAAAAEEVERPEAGGPSELVDRSPAAESAEGSGRNRRISTDDDDRELRMRYNDDDESLDIHHKGEIVFSDDDRSIVSISAGGYVRIEHDDGRHERTLRIEPARDGSLEFDLRVDGRRRDIEDEREWYEDMVLRFIRSTSAGAERRAERLHREGGADAILEEVPLLLSDDAKSIYLEELFDHDLDEKDTRRALREIGAIISDGTKRLLLITQAPRILDNPELLDDYFDVVDHIISTGDRRQVLMSILDAGRPSEDILRRMLESTRGIISDGDKRSVLLRIAEHRPEDGELWDEYLDVTGSIISSGDRRAVYEAYIEELDSNPEAVSDLLDEVRGIISDGDKASLLVEVAPRCIAEDRVVKAYLDAACSILSSGERRRVLEAFIDVPDLPEGAVVDVADAASGIISDTDKTSVLIEIARSRPGSDEVQLAVLDAARNVMSDSAKEKLLDAMLGHGDPSDRVLEEMLEFAESRIHSRSTARRLVRRIAERLED